MGWGDDVESDDGDESDDEEPLGVQLEKAIRGDGSLSDIGEVDLVGSLDEVENEELLREAWLEFDGEKQNLVKNRLSDMGVDVEGNDEDPSEADGDDGDPDPDDDGWGGSDEESESEAAEPAVESVEEMEDDGEGDEDEPAETSSSSSSSDSSGPPTPASAASVDELAERERRWKIMAWGPPKLFKTHMAFTMPEPVAFIDLEGKADDIAAKFTGKEIQVWQPRDMEATPDTKFRRAKKALGEAMEWLDWWYENEGVIGTIVVDSMSQMWEWAQIHHKIENYPLKDPEDVELSANFQSSQDSDWAVVKEYHNTEFREVIADSQYHFYWTAMERQDFEKVFEDDDNVQFMEPVGERDNAHKVDTIIHARKDDERGKVGDLTGSNFTDNVFVGLKKPTFPKVRDAIESIAAAEASDEPVNRQELAKEIGAETIIDFDPQRYVNQ